jgi:hypothetical protein
VCDLEVFDSALNLTEFHPCSSTHKIDIGVVPALGKKRIEQRFGRVNLAVAKQCRPESITRANITRIRLEELPVELECVRPAFGIDEQPAKAGLRLLECGS